MTITALDIKMRQSQRLTDNPDGGGRMVQTEIVDGQLNNLFPDIGDEERTTGRSVLRKMFVHVDTPAPDVLKDAIAAIIAPPGESRVSVTAFATGSYSDERAQARNRVESYITKGVESRFVLLGDHYIGQQAISLYAMKDVATPDIGDNLALSTSAQGYPAYDQYIRVRSILSRTTQTFYDEQGAFERDVVIVESETALLSDFYGQPANRRTAVLPPTRVHETNNIDAATYFGVKRLTTAAAPGDLTVNVGSPFVPIVPSTTAETPLVDQLAGLGTVSYVQAGADDVLAYNGSGSFAAGVGVTRYLGNPIVRGSATVVAGGTTLTDDGRGNLVAPGATPWSGTVDYAAGSVTVAHANGAGGVGLVITASPAGPIVEQAYSRSTPISANNQGYNHVMQVAPLPAPGTVVVDYRSLGRWVRLTDNGQGQLVGKPGQGSGTISYQTGSIVLTTGQLPDLNSAILWSWGTGVLTVRRDGHGSIQSPYLHLQADDEGLVPGSVTATWRVTGADVVATDDGAGAMKVGATVVGTVVYATGEVGLRPATLPDDNSTITLAYEWSPLVVDAFTPTPDGGGFVTLSLSGAPLRPGSVHLRWQGILIDQSGRPTGMVRTVTARDDGLGNLFAIDLPGITAAIGTVDYASGAASVRVSGHQVSTFVPQYAWQAGGQYAPYFIAAGMCTLEVSSGALITATYQAATALETAVSAEYGMPPVELRLVQGVTNSIVPGSVRFAFRGRTYVDRNGALYYGIDPLTGAGTYAGTIDYASGRATITQWAAGGANAVSVLALLLRTFDAGVSGIVFRTPGAPLRTGAFTLRATTVEGQQVTATADLNGNLTGTLTTGTVDWQTGVARVRFGSMVAAAGNENEPWFDPANVEGDQVWKPALMSAGTIHFGTVVYRSIPMSPVVVGLDPVRLPADGLVPVFKPGQTALVHHTQETVVASPVANAVTNLGRERIAQIEVRDNLGAPILSTWWTADLDAGTVTWADPLNLAAYQLPVRIRDRVEDRRLVAEVQITGEIALNAPLTHDYPEDAMVSTAIRLGEPNGSLDLQARAQGLFDIATWNGVWADGLAPGQATAPASYNDVDYPVEVTNADAITERWALRFTNATSFEIIGETMGIVGTGNTTTDTTPINPRTGEPIFTLRKEGWGLGWATNNALRLNVIGALAPLWLVRTTLAGPAELMRDGFRLQVIGNIQGETP